MPALMIMVAGPYSAPTPEGRAANLAAMNRAAASLAERGHIPMIGVNAALPVLISHASSSGLNTITAEPEQLAKM